jgi:hypothetical protein
LIIRVQETCSYPFIKISIFRWNRILFVRDRLLNPLLEHTLQRQVCKIIYLKFVFSSLGNQQYIPQAFFNPIPNPILNPNMAAPKSYTLISTAMFNLAYYIICFICCNNNEILCSLRYLVPVHLNHSIVLHVSQG